MRITVSAAAARPSRRAIGRLIVSLIACVSAPAQRNWIERGPFANGPCCIPFAPIAYDHPRGRMVICGMELPWLPAQGTWEWDGVAWTKASAVSPAATTGGRSAYDSVRQRVLLYNGASLWEWDGTTWAQRPSSASPPARQGLLTAVAYDSGRRKLVMFGGSPGIGGRLADTWEWDGNAWTQVVSKTSPPPRERHVMAYDESRRRIVLFGGYGSSLLSDTWEWDGVDWVDVSPTTSGPSARRNAAMAYDTLRRRVVLVGGIGSTGAMPDTWEWDGVAWTNATQSTNPELGSMTYDSARGMLVLYASGSNTWELASAPDYLPWGQGCAGTAGTPRLSAAPGSTPQVGSIFTVNVTNLPPGARTILHYGISNTSWGPVQLPVGLDFIGMTGCVMYSSGEFAFPLYNGAGTATWSFLVPNYPGVSFYNQAVVFDPGANPFGLTLSNPAEGLIGL